MPKIRWQHFVTGRDDRTINNVTFLSRPAEIHAVLMGFLAALFPSLIPPIVAYIAGRQLGKKAVPDLDIPVTLHLKDAAREPVYWVGAFLALRVVVSAVRGVAIIPPEVYAAIPL